MCFRTFINEKYATESDVHVGDIVDCVVKELEPAGAHLSLGRLTVFAPATHVTNFPVKIIKTKLSVGQQVKARVSNIEIYFGMRTHYCVLHCNIGLLSTCMWPIFIN